MVTPEVSVILTYHNRPKMVQRAIKNIIHQSFQDFELILVDDFSSDPLPMDEIDFSELNVTFIRNSTNVGANQSRLNGLNISNGKYVCFHDDDDYWMNDKLEKQYEFLEKNPNFHIVTAFVQANNKIIKFPIRPSIFSLSIHNCVGSFSVPMIRKSQLLFDSLDNSLTNAQDWNVWRTIRKYHEVASLEDILVFFDDGTHERISSVKNVNQYYSSYLKVALVDSPNILVKSYHKSLASYHCSDKLINRLIWGFITLFLRRYVKFKIWVEDR